MFAVFDVELANNSDKGSICSIGVVLVDNGQVVDSFYSLVNPMVEFSPMCVKIHHITPDDVYNAPTFRELWPTLLQYFRCGTLVAYRAEADIYPLKKALYDAGLETPFLRYACAYRISKKLLELDSYSLSSVAAHLGIRQQDAHHALDDAETTAHVVLALMRDLNVTTLNQLMRVCCLTYSDTLTNGYDPAQDTHTLPTWTPPAPLKHGDSDFFLDKNVVITGTLSCGSRESIRMTIESMGGIYRTKTSRKTDIVILGVYDIDTLRPGCTIGSKLQEAYDLIEEGYPIIILDENELLEILRA